MTKLLFAAIVGTISLLAPYLSDERAVLVDLSRTQLVERNYNTQHSYKEERCLTEAIFYEAGHQSEIGKEAVALVIMNRMEQKHRPKTICGVVTQARMIEERKVCQFSFWCEPKYKPNKAEWKESRAIAQRVMKNYWKSELLMKYQRAVFYHADYVKPTWRTSKVYLGKIDNHLFYGEKS